MKRAILPALVAVLLAPAAVSAAPVAATRPYTAAEALAKLVDESELLVLARVTSVEATTQAESIRFDPAFPPDMMEALRKSGPRLRRAHIEVVEWITGGLDGDAFDVFTVEGTGAQIEEPAGWHALAGVDTLGALIALTRHGREWALRPDPAAGLDAGFRVIPQRRFHAIVDSCAMARASLLPDSLLAHADLVAITGPSADAAAPRMQLAIERVLAGTAPPGELTPRLARARVRPGRRVMALRHTADGAYEPVPFHRIAWATAATTGHPPDTNPDLVEPEVRAALQRLAKARRGPAMSTTK